MGARSMKLQNANAHIYFELLWRIQRERERERRKKRGKNINRSNFTSREKTRIISLPIHAVALVNGLT